MAKAKTKQSIENTGIESDIYPGDMDQDPEKNLVAFAAQEDPLIRFFYRHQKLLSYLLITVLLGVIGYRYYQSSHLANQHRSAELLGKLEADLGKEDSTRFQSAVLGLKEQSYPYNVLAEHYAVMQLAKKGNYSEVKNKLANLNWKQADLKRVLWDELLALYLARALLAEKDYTDFALQQVQDLAENSRYVKESAESLKENYTKLPD